jgi:dehydrogenase/reductase SDR family protein 12
MPILDSALDASIVFSFDRTGFLRHGARFDPGDLGVDLTEKVCLVTGANSGIGRATAFALARLGATVRLLCRSRERGEEAVETLRAEGGSRQVHFDVVDMSSLDSIRTFAERLSAPRVDILVNNAGVLPESFQRTPDGLELTLATNLVGPFLLTRLLIPRLLEAKDARVVNVSSGGMYTQKLRVRQLEELGPEDFDGVTAYARTKRALVVLTELWAERHHDTSITFASMHPGWADTPGVRSSLPRFHSVMRRILRTADEGADTVVWLAAAPRVAGRSGFFWFDRQVQPTHLLPFTKEGAAERARLWEACRTWAASRPVPRRRAGCRAAAEPEQRIRPAVAGRKESP